jgi:hypothetical protein
LNKGVKPFTVLGAYPSAAMTARGAPSLSRRGDPHTLPLSMRKTNLARLLARRPRRNRQGICSPPKETVSPRRSGRRLLLRFSRKDQRQIFKTCDCKLVHACGDVEFLHRRHGRPLDGGRG